MVKHDVDLLNVQLIYNIYQGRDMIIPGNL